MKKVYFLLLAVMMTNSIKGMENASIINKFFNLEERIKQFVSDKEIQKALGDRIMQQRYIRFLTYFNSDTSTFNKKQCAYLRELLPGFEGVELIIHDTVLWNLLKHLELIQEHIALLEAQASQDPSWACLEERFKGQFEGRVKSMRKSKLEEIRKKAICYASRKIIEEIETTKFPDVEESKAQHPTI